MISYSEIIKKIRKKSFPRKLADEQIALVDRIYGLEKLGIKINYESDYAYKNLHPNTQYFFTCRAGVDIWEFDGLKGLETFLRDNGIDDCDVLGRENKTYFKRDSYYFEKDRVCVVFVDEIIPF